VKEPSKDVELSLFGKTKKVNNVVGITAMLFIAPISIFVAGVTLLTLFLLSLENSKIKDGITWVVKQ
jgi:hypothetical protein